MLSTDPPSNRVINQHCSSVAGSLLVSSRSGTFYVTMLETPSVAPETRRYSPSRNSTMGSQYSCSKYSWYMGFRRNVAILNHQRRHIFPYQYQTSFDPSLFSRLKTLYSCWIKKQNNHCQIHVNPMSPRQRFLLSEVTGGGRWMLP